MPNIELSKEEIELLLQGIEDYEFNINERYFTLTELLNHPTLKALAALKTKLTEIGA